MISVAEQIQFIEDDLVFWRDRLKYENTQLFCDQELITFIYDQITSLENELQELIEYVE